MENKELKKEEMTQDEEKTEKANIVKEAKLLRELFPNLDIDDIPEEVWGKCVNGEGIAAEYAFYLIRRHNEEKRAKEVDEKNAKSAPPKITHNGSDEVYFTPDAVSKMSDKDIEKNYEAIMRSMEHWRG